jgi:hypothetical protein
MDRSGARSMLNSARRERANMPKLGKGGKLRPLPGVGDLKKIARRGERRAGKAAAREEG